MLTDRLNEEHLECGHAGVLYACKGAHTLFTSQKEREKEGWRKKERKRKKK
jgi:hypothetical protein